MQIKYSTFKPAWWLSNPHLQTLWGALIRRRKIPALHYERLELPDNDFLDVAWGDAPRPDSPVILVLHGLNGSIQSHYIPGTLKSLIDKGWRPLFMHFRGCSGEPNRQRRSYHFGFTDDLDYLLPLIQDRFPNAPIAAIGYSLGGNVLLKWLGTRSENIIQAAVAVCVPFQASAMVDKLNRGFSRIYQTRFLRELAKNYKRKHQIAPMHLDLATIQKINNLREWDDKVTAPLYGFRNAEEYYEQTTSLPHLKNIKNPTLIIQAEDDPFMTEDCFLKPSEVADGVTIEFSRTGGHVGFVSGTWPWRPKYWLEERIPEFLATKVE